MSVWTGRIRLAFCFALVFVSLSALVGCPNLPSPSTDDDPLSRTGTVPLGGPSRSGSNPSKAGPGNYLFCFWNLQNLFDDRDDHRNTRGDKEYDGWFAENAEALKAKLQHVTDVLIPLNDGKGPDILAVCEVESPRAAELVQQALNARLAKPWHYTSVQCLNPGGGRHIAPAIITRLPVVADRTQLLGSRLRILVGHIQAAGKPLVVIASHWSSRVSDHDGGSRARYADQIYGHARGMFIANPKVDLLVAGDFNDNPDDESVATSLHASGDRTLAAASSGRDLVFFNLMKPLWDKGEASHYYGPKPYLFDQICVTPGLLDAEGWSVDTASAAVIPEKAYRNGRPNGFGNPKDKRPYSARGASDHFPVVVRLMVR